MTPSQKRHIAGAATTLVAVGALLSCRPTAEPQVQVTSAAPRAASPPGENSPPEDVPLDGAEGPRLVVWMTVEGLDTALLSEHEVEPSSSGIAELRERGLWFTDAHTLHTVPDIAPTVATAFSGSSPREHGIVADAWFDEGASSVVTRVDHREALVEATASEGDEAARTPRRLLVRTIADNLLERTKGTAQFLSVSRDADAAILPAGQAGEAYWWGSTGFTTSPFYGDAKQWLGSAHASPHSDEEARAPHHAIFRFARVLMQARGLGQDDVVDVLALGFSLDDAADLARFDRRLSAFLDHLDESVTREETGIVLSGAPSGEASSTAPSAAELEAAARSALQARFEAPDALAGVASRHVYLDVHVIEERGLDVVSVRDHIAEALEALDGVRFVHVEGNDRTELGERVNASLFPGRSGDLLVVAETDVPPESAQLPLVLAFPSVLGGRVVEESVDLRSLAPTVSALLSIEDPGATWAENLLQVSSRATALAAQ